VLTGDTDRILGALRDMGFVQQNSASDKLERVLAAIHERLRSAIRLETMALSDIKLDSRLVLDALLDLRALDVGLRELSEAFHVPSEWILLERTILMLTGICTTLDHELQPMEIIRPYVERLVLSEGEDWTSFGVETAKQVGAQLVVLPAEVRKALGILNRGRLEIRAPHLEDSLRRVYALGQQLMWTAFTISAGALSTVCELLGRSELATRFEWATAVFALLLMRSIFRARLRA
jgi:predicted unusual protein kinase regulating ubiquinone biosynthesis (AarF/ABC1/UbiB family)